MATWANFTTSTKAGISDRETLDSLTDRYTFEGDVELAIEGGSVRVRGADALRPRRSSDSSPVPVEFLADLVTTIDDAMKIQVVGNAGTRFSFRGQQYRLVPDEGVYLRTLDADETLVAAPGKPLR